MIAFLDADYGGTGGRAACLVVEDWGAERAVCERVVDLPTVEPYEPGSFYRRELPCLLAVLETLPSLPNTLVIDGYVQLSADGKPGLGARLHAALDGKPGPGAGLHAALDGKPGLGAGLHAALDGKPGLGAGLHAALDGKPGPGAGLHAALDGRPAVIGVAKSRFRGIESSPLHVAVRRGGSNDPLWVSAMGVDLAAAAEAIRTLHGPYRIPTLLRRVDHLARGRVVPVPDVPA